MFLLGIEFEETKISENDKKIKIKKGMTKSGESALEESLGVEVVGALGVLFGDAGSIKSVRNRRRVPIYIR